MSISSEFSEELEKINYIVRVDFAFTLMTLYALFPDEDVDSYWQYYCGRLVMGF